MASPLKYLNGEVNMWKFFGFFDVNSNSELLQLAFKIYSIFVQSFFVYIGYTMQTMAVFNAADIKEAVEILFISIAYLNAAVKYLIVYWKREEVQRLWKILDAPEFETIVEEENV